MMKYLSLLIVLLAAGAAGAGAVKEYSADMVDVKTGKKWMSYYVAKDNIRVDTLGVDTFGSSAALREVRVRSDQQDKFYSLPRLLNHDSLTYIFRQDRKKEYFLKERIKVIDKEVDTAGKKIDVKNVYSRAIYGGVPVKRSEDELGSETVNGYDAEKIKVDAVFNIGKGDTHTTTIYEWKADEFDIPVRIEAYGWTFEMRNIKIGAPDPSLFELPADSRKKAEPECKRVNFLSGKCMDMEQTPVKKNAEPSASKPKKGTEQSEAKDDAKDGAVVDEAVSAAKQGAKESVSQAKDEAVQAAKQAAKDSVNAAKEGAVKMFKGLFD